MPVEARRQRPGLRARSMRCADGSDPERGRRGGGAPCAPARRSAEHATPAADEQAEEQEPARERVAAREIAATGRRDRRRRLVGTDREREDAGDQ